MSRTRWIYLVGFPLVVFGLCAFSYYLGLERGRQTQPSVSEESPEGSPSPSSGTHESAEDLTFFKTLKEGGETPSARPKTESSAAKLAEKIEKTAEAKDEAGSIVVQVSAFRDVGKAHEMVDDLKNRGYTAFTHSDRKVTDGWYRVFVGPYPSKEKAGNVLEELVEKGFSKGFVTQLGPS